MNEDFSEEPRSLSPLEKFVRGYLETAGGVWEEVEPQVYDVLLPSGDVAALSPPSASGVTRITFDPEALSEHPGAQLASFGTPFIDRILQDAVQRGRSAQFYLIGANLNPHDLGGRVQHALSLPEALTARLVHVRALHFAQAVYWFQAEFVSDQKEQEVLPVAMDLHHGREVRHLDKLLERHRLAEQPADPLPDARRVTVAFAYHLAREQVLRSVAALARGRGQELGDRLERQLERVRRYYADLRGELDAERNRALDKPEALARVEGRREALAREEQMRVTELRQKSALRCRLRLLQLVMIHQPKLLLRVRGESAGHPAIPLELVWDPLMEIIEAIPCPICRRPSYAFELTWQRELVCPACAAQVPAAPGRKAKKNAERGA